MTSTLTHSIQEAAALREAWLPLVPESSVGFFLHPDWCDVVWGSFDATPNTKIHVISDGDKVVGLLPVWERRMNRFGLFQRVSEAFGGGRGDFSHPLLADPSNDQAMRELLIAGIREARRDGALVMANVPDRGGWADLVRSALTASGAAFSESRRECFHLDLPESFEEFSASVKSKLRSDVRRRIRKLESEVGEVTFERVTNPDVARALLPKLFEMHDRRWVEAGKLGAFSDPAMRAYFFGMVDRLWKHLHVTVLRCDGKPIAMHYGMTYGGCLLHFKPTFETRLYQYSPGKIHLWMLIECAIENGMDKLDFLQGEEGYKEKWATGSSGTSTFVVRTRRASLAYWWMAKGRTVAESLLGGVYLRLSSLLQRFRRPGVG